MSTATFTESTLSNQELGLKTLSIITGVINNVSWLVVAAGCASFWTAVLVYVLGALITGLMLVAALLYVNNTHGDKVEALGASAGKALSSIKGFFGR